MSHNDILFRNENWAQCTHVTECLESSIDPCFLVVLWLIKNIRQFTHVGLLALRCIDIMCEK